MRPGLVSVQLAPGAVPTIHGHNIVNSAFSFHRDTNGNGADDMDDGMDNEDNGMNFMDSTMNNLNPIICELVVETELTEDGGNEDEEVHNLDGMMDYELVEETNGRVEVIADSGMDDEGMYNMESLKDDVAGMDSNVIYEQITEGNT